MPVKKRNKPLKKKNSTRISNHFPALLLDLISRSPRSPLPKRVKPMLATLTDKAFDDREWLFEIKWDGYRAVAIMNGPSVSLLSRNDQFFNEKFYPIYQSLVKWNLHAVLDGEIVVLDQNGKPRFGALQNWRSETDGDLVYYIFDILWLDGHDLRPLPLRDRKKILSQLKTLSTNICLSEGFEQFGKKFFEAASKKGLEGVIAKKLDSTYQENQRNRAWLKIKTQNRQEVVIGGYCLNEGSDKFFSSLLAGVYKGRHLIYIGKIGTGFNQLMQEGLLKKFKPLVIPTSPFTKRADEDKSSLFRTHSPNVKTIWLKPKLICEVQFTEMTSEGMMRHASFQGLRTDKMPQAINLEEKIPEAEIQPRNINRIKM
jgi:bifunctional non-homologous end joining protein LigD